MSEAPRLTVALTFDHDAGVTEPPTEHELATLRILDPEQLYTA